MHRAGTLMGGVSGGGCGFSISRVLLRGLPLQCGFMGLDGALAPWECLCQAAASNWAVATSRNPQNKMEECQELLW